MIFLDYYDKMSQLTRYLFLLIIIGSCTCNGPVVMDSFPKAVSDELVSVVVLFCSGLATPVVSYPNDPYFNLTYWPQGFGQLVKEGIRSEYDLGAILRSKYDGFLPKQYSADDIKVYSTDTDKTLMSAQANLAGLYPPPESQQWDDDLLWEPIPVHVMAIEDPVLAMNALCPKREQLLEELDDSDYFQSLYQNYTKLLSHLSNLTGMKVETTTEVKVIYNVLRFYQDVKEDYLPDWLAEVKDDVEHLASVDLTRATFSDELSKLEVGPFYNYLINHFAETINGSSAKFLLLSAEDSTIASILNGVGAFDDHPPEASSYVVWELSKSGEDYYVSSSYNGHTIQVFDCKDKCSFEDFKHNLSSVVLSPEKWEDACSGSMRIALSGSFIVLVTILKKLV